MTTSPRPGHLRASFGRVAVTGAAALATVFAVAPAAFAETESDIAPDPGSSETKAPESTPEEKPAEEKTPAPEETEPEAPVEESPAEPTEETPAEETPESVLPTPATGRILIEAAPSAVGTEAVEYVAQQVTLRVDRAAGDFYAPDASDLYAMFSVEVRDQDGNADPLGACTILVADDVCTFSNAEQVLDLPAGSSVTITQTSAGGGMSIADPASQTVEAKVATPEADPAARAADAVTPQELVFVNGGLPPAAPSIDEYADSTDGSSTFIDPIGTLDENEDPETTLVSVGTPNQGGTAVLVERLTSSGNQVNAAAAAPLVIQYTPAEDFDGTETFTYTVQNSNGQTTGTIVIDVEGAEEIEGNFGSTKYYVGAQLADGSWAPEGITTEGSVFRIATTLPGEPTTEEFCTSEDGDPADQGFSECDGPRYTVAGSTTVITQVSAPAPLQKSNQTFTIGPCDLDLADEVGDPDCSVVEAYFDDLGPKVVARADSASTDFEEGVTIDVLANDDSGDPEADLTIGSQPPNGTATVVGEGAGVDDEDDGGDPGDLDFLCSIFGFRGQDCTDFINCVINGGFECLEFGPILGSRSTTAAAFGAAPVARAVAGAGSLKVRYVPDADFSGTDSFLYRVENSNGTSTARVTVTVRDGVVVDEDDAAGADVALPDTGGQDLRWLGLGALMIAAGGTFVARDRRRSKQLG